jgi:hypothetical protein
MAVASVLQHLVLSKALSICGSDRGLSRILNVSTSELRRWVEGEALVPLTVFNDALRLVNDSYRDARANNRTNR